MSYTPDACTLTDDQKERLQNATITAAVKYEECAASMRQEAARLAEIQTPSAAATTCLQLADVFDAQALHARQLAALLMDAGSITLTE